MFKPIGSAIAVVLFSQSAWAGLAECQTLSSQAKRLKCSEQLLSAYENYFVKQGLPLLDAKSAPVTSASAPIKVKTEHSEIKQAAANFGLEQKILAKKRQELASVSAKVLKVRKDAYGKLTLILDNQQIWKLAEKGLRLSKGHQVVIERGALGAFYLKKQGSSRKARAKRIQ